MLNLILARHGNTFAAGDRVVWAGARNDFPLVAEGRTQADRLREALREQHVDVARVICGPLSRTREYAQRLELGAPLIDKRLDELDYGEWSGLSNEEVIERFGRNELEGWDVRSHWPSCGAWKGSPESVFSEIRSLTDELLSTVAPGKSVVLVTSNGRLRYFAKLAPGEFEARAASGALKVKTGAVCRMTFENSQWRIHAWNKNPADCALR